MVRLASSSRAYRLSAQCWQQYAICCMIPFSTACVVGLHCMWAAGSARSKQQRVSLPSTPGKHSDSCSVVCKCITIRPSLTLCRVVLPADYVFGERKFGGNAQAITSKRWLHHTSLLWDYDQRNMAVLTNPKKQPAYRQVRLQPMRTDSQTASFCVPSCSSSWCQLHSAHILHDLSSSVAVAEAACGVEHANVCAFRH